MLLHELRHIETYESFVAAEHEVRQSASHFCFANASRSEEEERTDGAIRALQPGTRAADGASQCADRFFLRDDALVQLFFNAEQLLRFFFFN